MHFEIEPLILNALAVLGTGTSLAVIIWHARKGRPITLFATYMAILVLEFGGGLIQSALGESSLQLRDCGRPLIVRLASLGPFCAGYIAISVMLHWRSGPLAAREIAEELHDRVDRSVVARLWVLCAALSLCNLYPLYVKVRLAGGVSAFLDVAYSMRFGTHGEAATENMMIVAAGLLAGPLMAVITFLTMVAAGSTRVSLRSWLPLGAALSLNLAIAAMHGRRIGVVIAAAIPLMAWHLQRPIALRALMRFSCFLLLGFLCLNWLHYYRYSTTAHWEPKSFSESSMSLLAPQQHLETLAEVLNGADRSQLLGATQYAHSAAALVPRAIWLDKPEHLGSLAVQGWAGLPTHFQMAVTDVGEAVACMGYAGMATIALWGILYSMLDCLMYSSMVGRAVVVGICVTRVLTDQGMGVSALSNSMVCASIATLLLWMVVPRRLTSAATLLSPQSTQ